MLPEIHETESVSLMPTDQRSRKKEEGSNFGPSMRRIRSQKSGQSLDGSSPRQAIKIENDQDEVFLKNSTGIRKLALALQNLCDNFLDYGLDKIKESAEPLKRRKYDNESSDLISPLLLPTKGSDMELRTPLIRRSE